MKNYICPKYFRVYLYQTTVSEVLPEYLRPVTARLLNSNPTYSLLSEDERFCDYPGRVRAMECAKKGALSHINKLIKDRDGADELVQYRFDHYDDLNFHLTEENIRKIENELKKQMQYGQN